DNIARDFTVDELAEAVALAPRTFARRIAATCSVSPIQFVQRIRIETARYLLETTRRRRAMGPLSVDLRKRVVAAVREEGMSCRAAARRFGVSFASAIRWVAALRERGSCAPLPMGGDQRSGRVEAHADYLLGL